MAAFAATSPARFAEVAKTGLQFGIDVRHFILHQALELGHLAPLQFVAAAALAIDGRLEIRNGLLRRGKVFRLPGQFPGGGGDRLGVRLQRAILIVQAQGDGDQGDRVAVADESALDLVLVFLFVDDRLFQIGDQDLHFRGQIVGRGKGRELWRGAVVAGGGRRRRTCEQCGHQDTAITNPNDACKRLM